MQREPLDLVVILVGAMAILLTWVWLGLGSLIIISATQNPALLGNITAFLALMAVLTVMVDGTQEDAARKWYAESATGATQLNATTYIYGLMSIPTMGVWLILLSLSILSATRDPQALEEAGSLIAALGFMAVPASDMRKNLFRKWRGETTPLAPGGNE